MAVNQYPVFIRSVDISVSETEREKTPIIPKLTKSTFGQNMRAYTD